MAERTLAASKFKAHCLQILEDVARTGAGVTVTKRGRPIARLLPITETAPPSLLGSVRFEDDDALLQPIEGSWEAESAP